MEPKAFPNGLFFRCSPQVTFRLLARWQHQQRIAPVEVVGIKRAGDVAGIGVIATTGAILDTYHDYDPGRHYPNHEMIVPMRDHLGTLVGAPFPRVVTRLNPDMHENKVPFICRPSSSLFARKKALTVTS